MDAILTALADPARWRLVTLLAERPRPVGVLAQLAAARQPQTTKHLQTLERAGVVTSRRSGQRRIYALRSEPLRALAAELGRLADTADSAEGRGSFDRYGLSLEAERLAARGPGWADRRFFRFRRSLPAAADVVWRHLTDESLLATWWAPDDLVVSELVFEARPGGRILLEYRDAGAAGAAGDAGAAENANGSGEPAGRAEGFVDDVRPAEHLAYRLSPLLPDGSAAFTSHVDLGLEPTGSTTQLDVRWRLSDSTVGGADFVAGIEIGFGQSLDKLAAVLAAGSTSSDNPDRRST